MPLSSLFIEFMITAHLVILAIGAVIAFIVLLIVWAIGRSDHHG